MNYCLRCDAGILFGRYCKFKCKTATEQEYIAWLEQNGVGGIPPDRFRMR